MMTVHTVELKGGVTSSQVHGGKSTFDERVVLHCVLALPQSGRLTVFTLACWVCGTNLSTFTNISTFTKWGSVLVGVTGDGLAADGGLGGLGVVIAGYADNPITSHTQPHHTGAVC